MTNEEYQRQAEQTSFGGLLEALMSAAVQDRDDNEKIVRDEIEKRIQNAKKLLEASLESCCCLHFDPRPVIAKLS